MSLAVQTLGLLVLVACTAVGPGLLLVRPLRWTPLETLVASVAASGGIIYFAGFGCFLLPAGTGGYWAVSVIGAAVTAIQWRVIHRLLGNRSVRRTVAGYCLLAGWCFALLCCVRHYGGYWSYDWAEHYQRTQVFVGQLPIDTLFNKLAYTLPARPPMMNVIAAFYCRQVGLAPQGNVGPAGMSFEIFSLACLLLNATAFLPCCLFYRWFVAGRFSQSIRRGGVPLLLLLALNPTFAANATYTWTKFLCVAYVIVAVYFYLRGWRTTSPGTRRAGSYTIAAFVCLGLAMMVHYSAAPYAAALAGHLLWRTARQVPGDRPSLLFASALAGVAVASPWFVWSSYAFGPRTTLLAYFRPATLADPDSPNVSGFHRLLTNVYRTFIPYPPRPFHHPLITLLFGTDSRPVFLSDYWFTLAQSNPVIMMGSLGGVVILALFFRALLRPGTQPALTRQTSAFWLWLLGVLLTFGLSASAYVEVFGSGRLVFPPLLLIGVTLLAACLPALPGPVKALVLLGSAVDLCLGILLPFHLEHTAFRLRLFRDGRLKIESPGYGPVAAGNWWTKHSLHLVFWGDHVAPLAPLMQTFVILLGVAGVLWLARATFRRPLRS